MKSKHDVLTSDFPRLTDILRHNARPEEAKEYIFSLFTLKVLNDNDDHPFTIPQAAEWSRFSSGGHFIVQNLKRGMEDIERENRDLEGVFTVVGFEKLPDEIVVKLVQEIDRFSLNRNMMEHPDPLTGTVAQVSEKLLDYLVRQEGKAGGWGTTPNEISNLLGQILDPNKGSAYDGVTGFGGSMIEVAKPSGPDNITLYGQEINPHTWSICRMNLILHGLYNAKVILGDTIRHPSWLENGYLKKFDYVIMDPPFALRHWGREEAERDLYSRFKYGIPSAGYGDMAFVLHAIASLNEKGKAALVVPHGVLFRGGAEQKIRQALLNDDLIDTIIALPPNLYLGTGIPVAVLIINKNKSAERKEKVQLISAEEGFDRVMRIQNRLRQQDIKKIVNTYLNGKEIEHYSRFVSLNEIEKNEWNLNINRYFEAVEVETKIGTVKISSKIYQDSRVPKVDLGNVAELSRGILPPKDQDGDPTHKLINLSDVQDGKILLEQLKPVSIKDPNKADRYEVYPGDLILASRGTALKIAVVPETDEKLLLSNNFIRLRAKGNYDPHFLKFFLESPVGIHYLQANQRGSAVTVLSPKDIKSIPVPAIPAEEQQKLAKAFVEADRELEGVILKAHQKHEDQYQGLYQQLGIAESIERTER